MAESSEDISSKLAEQVSLLSHELQVAKQTIDDLHSRLESRESELRLTKDKQQVSFRRRSRRRKLAPSFNRNSNVPGLYKYQEKRFFKAFLKNGHIPKKLPCFSFPESP